MVKDEFAKEGYWGLSTTVDLKSCDKELIRNPEYLKKWVLDLVKALDMKPFGEPTIEEFGAEEHLKGYTVMQMIYTSSITAHFCNSSGDAYIDIFSCKGYEPDEAAEFCARYFSTDKYDTSWMFRG